jgi:folate-binding protein YgfZ
VNLAYRAARETSAFRHRHEQGVVRVTGANRLSWLNGLLTNDVVRNRECYSAWLTPQGRMITDMFVVAREDDVLLEVPGSVATAVTQRLDGLVFAEDVQIADASADLFPLEIFGPDATTAVDAVRHSLPVTDAAVVRTVAGPLPGAVVYISRTALAGALESLAHAGAIPVDDETAEILRVEAGIPRFLVDMNEETIPLEAGLDHAISHTKGCYVGQEIIVRIRDRAHGRVARHLVGLQLDAADVSRAPQGVLSDGRQIGRMTSAVRSIALDAVIALATLHRDASAIGTALTLESGIPAIVASLPFVVAPPTAPFS